MLSRREMSDLPRPERCSYRPDREAEPKVHGWRCSNHLAWHTRVSQVLHNLGMRPGDLAPPWLAVAVEVEISSNVRHLSGILRHTRPPH